MREFLRKLGINTSGQFKGTNTYVIDIDDSDEYGKIYSKLDKSILVDEDPDSSQLTESTSTIQYESDDYILTLIANFDLDEYKLTIKRR